MRCVILGAGSIGCWIGGHLQAAGIDTHFIGRARYQDQITANGLTLTHFARDALHLKDVSFGTTPDGLRGADVIGLCVKSQDTADAAELIKTHAPKATVISFQNGVSNVATLRAALPEAIIIGAVVPFNVTPTAPGTFHSGTEGAIILGEDPGIATALRSERQEVTIEPEIEAAQWAKLIVNLNNGLNTLQGGTLLDGLHQRDYRRASVLQMKEALEIAKASGIEPSTFNGRSPAQVIKIMSLPNWIYKPLMQTIVKIDAKARSSMLDDLEAGRACEIDYLQGEIVRAATRLGRDAPVNGAVYEAVNAAFKTGKSPGLSGTELLNLVK